MAVRPFAAIGAAALAVSLAACQDSSRAVRSTSPVPAQTLSLMSQMGMAQNNPILIRAYKKEAEMEVWKRNSSGQYALLKTFPICRWSGQLGPKLKQGDRQAPEGFYTITPGQMNPNSAYYLSFDVGYPNAIDRAKGATGNYIMVHGTCSSAGCFAMTDASIAEVYALARDAFSGGQRAFQFQSYPFRMTARNMAKFRNDPNAGFWKNLKQGSDYFEALRDEPRVAACGTRYAFGGADVAAGSCTPRIDPVVAEKSARDEQQVAELVARGERATRMVYEDGDLNPVFRRSAGVTAFASLDPEKDKERPYSADEYASHRLGDVSRPESLMAGPREIEIDAKGRPVIVASTPPNAPGPTKVAAAALGKKGAKGEPASTLAAAPPERKDTPARIAVADADGDSSSYQKLLGNLFGDAPPPKAAEPAPAPVAEPAPPAKGVKEKPSANVAALHVARAKAAQSNEAEPAAADAKASDAKNATKKPASTKPVAEAKPAADSKDGLRGRN